MSRGSDTTANYRAITAYRMRCNGETNRAIADFLGIGVDRIPVLVPLGERLDSLNDKEDSHVRK